MKRIITMCMMVLMLLTAQGAFAATIENADGSRPFVRWVVYRGTADDMDKVFQIRENYAAQVQGKDGVYAFYGGIDSAAPEVYRGLEIYRDKRAYEGQRNSRSYREYTTAIAPFVQKESVLDAEAFQLETKSSGKAQMVRMARLVVDPAGLDDYKAALKEEIIGSVAHEPGVKALLATTEKENPNIFHLLEIYEDETAYQKHIAGPYFQKYNETARRVVQDKSLILNKRQDVVLAGRQAGR